jgi:predicted dithiol-disulfide oxidoreductase (DUF899 family)
MFNFLIGVYLLSRHPGDGRAQSEFHHPSHRRLGNGYLPFSPFWKGPAGQIRKKEFVETYSTYARGNDPLIGIYNYLDLVPKGRDEFGLRARPRR